MSYTLSLDDMFSSFPHFSDSRKLAIAFAVYANSSVAEVIDLKWSDAIALNWQCELILGQVQPSNTVDYVFWETIQGSDVKLYSLPTLVNLSLYQYNWTDFVTQYKQSIPIEFNRVYALF